MKNPPHCVKFPHTAPCLRVVKWKLILPAGYDPRHTNQKLWLINFDASGIITIVGGKRKKNRKRGNSAKREMFKLLGVIITRIAEILGIISFVWGCINKFF
jgi:hypothetical protein